MSTTLPGMLETFVGNVPEMIARFADAALADPISAVLLALGALVTTASVAVFGGLVAGSALEAIGAISPGQTGPPAQRGE